MNEENNKIVLDLNLFKFILDQEVKKLTGKTMKRFELSIKDEKDPRVIKLVNDLKAQTKEIQYEWARDFCDTLKTGKIIFEFSKGGKNV